MDAIKCHHCGKSFLPSENHCHPEIDRRVLSFAVRSVRRRNLALAVTTTAGVAAVVLWLSAVAVDGVRGRLQEKYRMSLIHLPQRNPDIVQAKLREVFEHQKAAVGLH